MTKKLIDERIDETAIISAGPDQINQMEVDVADLIGFDIDQLYADSPFSFDEDGNLTSQRAGESAQVIFTDAEGECGFRIADETNNKEVLISLEDDYLIIYENRMVADGGTGVIRKDGDWKQRFHISLHGGSGSGVAGDGCGQDILNHLRMPTSIDNGSYLRGNTITDTIEWASVDVGTRDSCGLGRASPSDTQISGAGAYQNFHGVLTAAWDNNGLFDQGTGDPGDPCKITIVTSGIYLITINCSWTANSTGYRVAGYGASNGDYTRGERCAAAPTGNPQIQAVSIVSSLSASDNLIPVFAQTSTGPLDIIINEFSATLIAEE